MNRHLPLAIACFAATCAPAQKPGEIAVQGAPGGADMQKMMDEMRKQYGK